MKEKNILKDLEASARKFHKIYAERTPSFEEQQKLIDSNLTLIKLFSSLLRMSGGGEVSPSGIVGYLCYFSDHLWSFSPTFEALANK